MIRNKKDFRLFFTLVVTLLYCLLWMALEWAIFGQIQNDIVDNFMMVMFMPTIWMAMGATYDDLKKYNDENKETKG